MYMSLFLPYLMYLELQQSLLGNYGHRLKINLLTSKFLRTANVFLRCIVALVNKHDHGSSI